MSFKRFNRVQQEIHLQHSTLLGLAIVYSWVLWTIVSLSDYAMLTGWTLIKEVAIDFFQQVIETTILLELSLLYIRSIVRIMWRRKKNMKNLLVHVTVLSILNGISSLASGYAYSIIYPDENIFGKIFFTDYVDLTILSTTYLVVFLMNRYKNEETITIQTKLKNLSLQTDNHFVLNCFGTLSGLIETAPEQAELFLNKLSDVYRFLVTKGNDSLVSIKEELKFVQDYATLINYRYSGIELIIDGGLSDETKGFVCPVALQGLVENAVKHNRHGKNNLLSIKIGRNGNYITVSNNIMPRQDEVYSTESGLSFLRERYSILTPKQIIISANNGQFAVSLPVINIEKKRNESPDY